MIQPTNGINHSQLAQSMNHPEVARNITKNLKLYAYISESTTSLENALKKVEEAGAPEKIRMTEEAEQLADVILQTFDKKYGKVKDTAGLNKSTILGEWIGQNTNASGVGAYEVLHRLVENLAKIKKFSDPFNQPNKDGVLANLVSIDRAAFLYISTNQSFPFEFPEDVMNIIVSNFVQTHPPEETIPLKKTSKKTRQQVIQANRGRLAKLNIKTTAIGRGLMDLNIKTAAQAIEFAREHGKDLKYIDISFIKFTRKELVALLDCLPNINVFIAEKCSIDAGGAAVLAACKNMKNVVTLYLSGNRISRRGAQALAASKFLKNLREVNLNDNQIGPVGTKFLVASENMKNLEKLDLSNNGIGDVGMTAIGNSQMKKVICLYLGGNRITPIGAKAFADSPILKDLLAIDFSNNLLGDKGTAILVVSENLKNVIWLFLNNNEIGNKGAKAIFVTGHLKNLEILDLSSNAIEGVGADIEVSKNLTNVETLDLSYNKIGDEEVIAIANLDMPNLVVLGLCNNKIGDNGAIAIAGSNHPHLELLDLNGNPIKRQGILAINSSDHLKKTEVFMNPILDTFIGSRG